MKNRLVNIYVITMILVFNMNCESNSNNNIIEKLIPSAKGDIVLVLNKMPENWRYSMENGAYSHQGKHEIEYTLEGIIPTYYFSDYSKEKDTIFIKNIDHPIEIRHKFNGHDILSFIANPNDTLIFSYDEKTPVLQNLSKSNSKYDYEYLIRKNNNKGSIPSYTKYTIPYIFLREDHSFSSDISDFKKALIEYKKKYSKIAKLELHQEKRVLDSLKINNGISEQFYKFYNLRIQYQNKILNIKQKESTTFKDYDQVDSLMQYSFYKDYINAILENGILKKVKIKESTNYSIPNPEAIYDSISVNPYLNNETKRYLSFQWLENIMNSSSNKKNIDYFKLFKSQYKNDTLLTEYLIEKYKLNASFSNDLTLEDEHGHETTFQEILKNSKGKILYVDFWASWCAPCRAAMPSSHILREKFEKKGVVFIYLALNDNKINWKKAMQQEKLGNYKNSYIINNSKTSAMIDDLDIQTIPRYIIYNKNQKIAFKNAPAPNDSDIERLLNSLLLEE